MHPRAGVGPPSGEGARRGPDRRTEQLVLPAGVAARPYQVLLLRRKPDKAPHMRAATRRLVRLVAGLTILFVSPLDAQQIVGRLMDSETGQPIASVAVDLMTLDGARVIRTLTNAEGAYSLTAPAEGSYLVRTQHIGYAPATSSIVNLDGGGRTVLDLELTPSPIALQGITAVGVIERRPGELGGFYDRQRSNMNGRYVTREEFENWSPNRFTDILTILGVRVDRNFQPRLSGSDCTTFVIDGVRVPRNYTQPGIDGIANVRDVEAVEVYRFAAHVPVEFTGAFNECGAIFIWTRYPR